MAMFGLLGRAAVQFSNEYIAAAGGLSIEPSPGAQSRAEIRVPIKEMTSGGLLF